MKRLPLSDVDLEARFASSGTTFPSGLSFVLTQADIGLLGKGGVNHGHFLTSPCIDECRWCFEEGCAPIPGRRFLVRGFSEPLDADIYTRVTRVVRRGLRQGLRPLNHLELEMLAIQNPTVTPLTQGDASWVALGSGHWVPPPIGRLVPILDPPRYGPLPTLSRINRYAGWSSRCWFLMCSI